jgi:DUF4097 and DUF4098 domain-containing protein YvlB
VTTSTRRGLSRPFVVFGVVVGVLCTLYAAAWLTALTVSQDDRSVRTYAGVDHLRIDGGNGDITVIAEPRDDVEVIAKRQWSLAEPKLEQRFEGGALRLSGSCGFWSSIGPGCSTDFELHVPRDIDVDVRGSSGNVRAEGLTGRAYVGTSSGDVRVLDATGPLTAGASSGDVDVEGYGGRDVSARAGSGDVSVRTRAVPDRVRAVASSGDVTVVVPGSAAYRVDTRTGSGEETVKVDQARDSRHLIEAIASSGDVDVVRLEEAR